LERLAGPADDLEGHRDEADEQQQRVGDDDGGGQERDHPSATSVKPKNVFLEEICLKSDKKSF
jgi:hypothetical protein